MASYDDFTLELKNANPIDSIISSYVPLKKRGRTFVCNCPFHSEKTPSFTVFPDTQTFYCFGCGAGGDIFTFIMKAENLDFLESVRFIAEKSGMTMPERSGNSPDNSRKKTRIYEMNRIAANFFYKNLISGRDKTGLDYLINRRLSPQTIKKFGLGYASDSWDELCTFLTSKGYSEYEIIDAWLAGRSQKSNRLFDMFRKRVMFPIVDIYGNVIGFGGRVLDNSKPKYLNTSATPVFDKGSNLFAMNFARNSDSKRIILCEGYMDVIAVNQAGFENAVATLGTAITPAQARLIKRNADEVIIAYDSDGAGQTATRKAISHFSDVGLKTRILRMDGAKDPDEYIQKFGAQRFRMLIDKSDNANNFLIDRCENGLDTSEDADKVELLKRVTKVLAEIPSELEREVYISRTAQKYDIAVDVLKSHIEHIIEKNNHIEKKDKWRKIKVEATLRRDEINPEAVKFKKEANAEEMIICRLMQHPEDAALLRSKIPPELFATPFNKKVYEIILNVAEKFREFSISHISGEFSPEEMGKITGIPAKNREMTISLASIDDCAAVLKNHKAYKPPEELTNQDLAELFYKKKS